MIRRRGYTLMEILITVSILGILAAIAIPRFGKVAERQRYQEAASLLGSIYAGEQAYATRHDGDYRGTPANKLDWRNDLMMDDPNPADGSISYTIQISPGADKFTASAKRTKGGCNNKSISVDQDGVWSDTWRTAGCF
ncbi:MAG TPA: type II secretion system protein [bacterium]